MTKLRQHKRFLSAGWLVGLAIQAGFLLPQSALADYSTHEQAQAFIDEMVATHGFTAAEVKKWLAGAERKQPILDAISRPAEKAKPWSEYRKIFLTDDRISKGVEFWREHRDALSRAEATYGVPAEVIVAIIGVETRYGRQVGNYRVMDALATLAFDYPPRSPFFRKELQQFLLLTREQARDPLTLKGSYAGAMGYGQFMPSSYRNFAVDFDQDGTTDIWNNPVDAIGSVAHYFREHGWQPGQAVVASVKAPQTYDQSLINGPLALAHTVASLGKAGFIPAGKYDPTAPAMLVRLEGDKGTEFWLGLNNFYVITRYNRSSMYALSVYQLSQAIASSVAQSNRQAGVNKGNGAL